MVTSLKSVTLCTCATLMSYSIEKSVLGKQLWRPYQSLCFYVSFEFTLDNILNMTLKYIFQFYLEFSLWPKSKAKVKAIKFLGLSKNWTELWVWNETLRKYGTYCLFLKIQQILRNTILLNRKQVSDCQDIEENTCIVY